MTTKKAKIDAGVDAMKRDPAEFRRHVWIDAGDGPRLFTDVQTPWQAADFAAMDASWQRSIGLPAQPRYKRAIWMRGRGCSKTSDVALLVTWAIWAAPSAVDGLACAGSEDQAKLVLGAIRRLLRLNSWLASTLKVENKRLVNRVTGSELCVLSSDPNLSLGRLIDFCVIDEFCSWSEGSEPFWSTIFSTLAKKRRCTLTLISNAGVIGSFQHKVCEKLRASPTCYYSQTDETETLLDAEDLEEQRRTLTPSAFDKYFRNIFVPAHGDGFPEDELLALFKDYEYPMPPEKLHREGWIPVGGCDLSRSRNDTCYSIVAVNPHTTAIRLAWFQRFSPRNNEIDLGQVDEEVLAVHRRYRPISWHMDQYESKRLEIAIRKIGGRVHIESFQSANNARMAACLLTAVRTGQLELPRKEVSLLDDFRRISLTDHHGVTKISAERKGQSHADGIFSIIVTLNVCQELASRQTFAGPPQITTGRSESRDPRRHGIPLMPHKRRCRDGIPFVSPRTQTVFYSSNPKFS